MRLSDIFAGPPASPLARGAYDCVQDTCENAPFGSVGGLEARAALQRPTWITEADWPEYLRGYEFAALDMYGPDWRTCTFGWTPAMRIGGEDDEYRNHLPDCPCSECCPEELCSLCGSAACLSPEGCF